MRFGYCAASSGSLFFCDGVPGSLVGVRFCLSARRRPVLASPTGAPLPETPLVASDLPAAPLGRDGRRPALAEWALVTAMTVVAGFLGQLVAAELRAAGWPRASRWSSAVVVGPSGRPFDAVDAVARAIHQADPSKLSALLAAAPGG